MKIELSILIVNSEIEWLVCKGSFTFATFTLLLMDVNEETCYECSGEENRILIRNPVNSTANNMQIYVEYS
jgi:hypothetical protein